MQVAKYTHKYFCLVCGFAGLKENPDVGYPREICQCCGIKYDNKLYPYYVLRLAWITEGFKWKGESVPKDWSVQKALKQLENIKVFVNIENLPSLKQV